MGWQAFLAADVKKMLKTERSKRAIAGDAVIHDAFLNLVDIYQRKVAVLKNKNSFAMQPFALDTSSPHQADPGRNGHVVV